MNYGITGESCTLPGRYRCFGSPEVKIILSAGQPFPPNDGMPAYWILVSPVHRDRRVINDHKARLRLGTN